MGRLEVHANSGVFAGRASGWIDLDEIKRFGSAAGVFPLTDHVRLATGFGPDYDHLEQEQIGLSIYPMGGKGQLGVAVHLRSPEWPGDRSVREEVWMELLTTYEQLRRFSEAIDGFDTQHAGFAFINVEVLE